MTREQLVGELRTGTAVARAAVRAAPALRILPLVALLGMGGCGIWGGGRPSEDDQKVRLSAVFLSAGAADAALVAADEVLAKQPRNAGALEARGNALAAMGRDEEAQQAYLQAIAISPSNTSARLALGRMQIRLNPQVAEQTLDQLLKRDPRNVAALSNIGVARDLQGRHADAQQAYRKALATDPKNTGAATNLGLSLVLSGNMAEAAAVLQPLADGPSPSEAVVENLAIALAATGDTAAAGRQLARILPPDQVGPTLDSYRRVPTAAPSLAAVAPPAEPAVPVPAVPIPAAPAPLAAAPTQRPQTVAAAPAATTTPIQVAAPVVPPDPPRSAASMPEPVPTPAVPVAPPPAALATTLPPGEAMATHAQVAMSATPERTMEAWGALRDRLPSGEAPTELRVVSMAYNDQGMFALRAGPFAQPDGAIRFCVEVRAAGGDCWAMTPAAPALPIAAAIPAARTMPLTSASPGAPGVAEPAQAVPAQMASSPPTQAPAAAPAPAPVAAPTAAPVASPAAPPPAMAPAVMAAAPTPIVPTPSPLPPGPAVPLAVAPSPVTPAPGAPQAEASSPVAPPPAGTRVSYAQLSATASAEGAEGEWAKLRARFGTLLAGREALTQTAEVGGRKVWRLSTGPFRAASEAEAFCAEVRSAGGQCWSATVTAGS